jgi:hypothetical protein
MKHSLTIKSVETKWSYQPEQFDNTKGGSVLKAKEG